MTDLSVLGMRFESDEAVVATDRLDNLAASAGKTERATDGMSAASRRSNSAIAAMLAQVVKSVQAIEAQSTATAGLARAQTEAAMTSRAQAQAAKETADEQRRAAAAAAELVARTAALKASVDPLGASIDRVNAELREANALHAAGALSEAEHGKATAILTQRMRDLEQQQSGVVRMSGRTSAGILNLSRNFADVGVTAAMGMNPLMILIQQGPQIADAMGEIRKGGTTVTAAMRGMAAATWAAMAPFLPFIAAAGALAAILGGGFLLGARNANKATGDLTKGLGLTEKQLEKVKQKTITFGDTFMATMTVIGRHLMTGPIGKAIDWIGDAWGNMLDGLTKGMIGAMATVIAAFKATAKIIQERPTSQNVDKVWMTEFNASKAGATKDINGFFGEITDEAKARRLKQIRKDAGSAPKGRKGPEDRSDEAIQQAKLERLQAEKALARDISEIADLAAQEVMIERDKKNAKLAADVSEGSITAAAARQATLLNNETADLEEQAIRRQEREDLDNESIEKRRTIATFDDRARQAAMAMASSAAEINALEASALRQRQIDERVVEETTLAHSALGEQAKAQVRLALEVAQKAERELAARDARVRAEEERSAIDQAALEGQIDLLAAQEDAAETETARVRIARERMEAEYRLAQLAQEQIIFSETATMAEKQIAIARMAQLAQQHDLDVAAAAGTAAENFESVSGALESMASAFNSRNWMGVVQNLDKVMATFQKALGGKLGAIAGLASGVGGMIGGTAGNAISGAASGAMGGASLVASLAAAGTIIPGIGNVAGALIGGAIGLIGGIFGGSSAKKKAKAEAEEKARQEAAAKALQIANEKRQLELTLLGLEQGAWAATLAEREHALEVMDESNRALQQQVWAAQDAAATRELEIQLLEAQGRAEEAAAARHKDALLQLSETDAAIQRQIYAEQDLTAERDKAAKAAADLASAQQAVQVDTYQKAVAAVTDLQSQVVAGYNEQAGSLSSLRDRMTDFAKGLREFGRNLEGSGSGLSNPSAAYMASRNEFLRLSSMPAGSEERLAGLPQASQEFLNASKAYNATSLGYLRDLAAVKLAVQDSAYAAEQQASLAQQQLDALTAEVAALGVLNQTSKDIHAAITALAAAISAMNGAGAVMDPQWGAIRNMGANQELAAATGYQGAFGQGGFQSWIVAQTSATQAIARAVLTNAGQTERIQGFATGGNFGGGLRIVGEEGPEIEATGPARYWNDEQTAEMIAGSADTGLVEQKLDEVIGRLDGIKANTGKTAWAVGDLIRFFANMTTDGRSLATKEAA